MHPDTIADIRKEMVRVGIQKAINAGYQNVTGNWDYENNCVQIYCSYPVETSEIKFTFTVNK